MKAITEIKLIMRTSIVDEQIESSRIHSRNMNSTTISNRKDRNTYGATGAAPLALRLSPMSLRKRLPRSGKKSSSVKSWLPAVARVRSPDFNSARRMERRREWL